MCDTETETDTDTDKMDKEANENLEIVQTFPHNSIQAYFYRSLHRYRYQAV